MYRTWPVERFATIAARASIGGGSDPGTGVGSDVGMGNGVASGVGDGLAAEGLGVGDARAAPETPVSASTETRTGSFRTGALYQAPWKYWRRFARSRAVLSFLEILASSVNDSVAARRASGFR